MRIARSAQATTPKVHRAKYPSQMDFRVGAKSLNNRSVLLVHEDCEVDVGNTPEGSYEAGIVEVLNSNLI